MPARNRRLRKIRPAFAAMLAVAAVAAWMYATSRPTAAEWAAEDSRDGASWPVMSFNLHEGGQPASAILDAIAQARPELVCLQELTAGFATAFEQRLGAQYPYRLFEARHAVGGIGIASRRPLIDGEILDLDLPVLPAAAATIEAGAARIRLACVHLMPPHAGFRQGGDLLARYRRNQSMRIRQAERLVEALDAAALPAIILGDMNEWQGQEAMSRLAAAGFTDACGAPSARCGATWPGAIVPLPASFRIDHILGRGLDFTHTAVLQASGSDHYPVAARIAAVPGRSLKVVAQ